MGSNNNAAANGPTKEELLKKWEDYIERIVYSDRYSDDTYEYRHVILPKPLLKLIPKQYFNPDDSGTLRLLAEQEWRSLGITQSLGWVHYEVHTPEPHVLLFRRDKNFQAPVPHAVNGKPVAQQVKNRK